MDRQGNLTRLVQQEDFYLVQRNPLWGREGSQLVWASTGAEAGYAANCLSVGLGGGAGGGILTHHRVRAPHSALSQKVSGELSNRRKKLNGCGDCYCLEAPEQKGTEENPHRFLSRGNLEPVVQRVLICRI